MSGRGRLLLDVAVLLVLAALLGIAIGGLIGQIASVVPR